MLTWLFSSGEIPLALARNTGLLGLGFLPGIKQWFARHAPRTLRGLVLSEEHDRGIVGRARRHLWLWLAKPDFLAYDVRDLPSAFAESQRTRGLPVLVCTVNSPARRVLAAEYADAPIAEGAGVEKGRP